MLLGVHVSQSSTVVNSDKAQPLELAISRDLDKLQLNAAQVFVSNPRNGVISKLNYESIVSISKDIDITVHSAYCTVSVWKVNKINQHLESSKRIIANFTKQIIATKNISGWCLVIHISKVPIDVIVETMSILIPIAKEHKIVIGLEMISSKATKTTTYETPEKINALIKAIGKSPWYGVVVDTSHIHGAGVDVVSYNIMHHWLESIIEKKKIIMFHLNGSYAERGSGKDKHAIIFSPEDIIWHGINPRESGVRAVIEFAVKNSSVIILEVNRGTPNNVAKAINTIKDLAR
jgi:hypothetical protein